MIPCSRTASPTPFTQSPTVFQTLIPRYPVPSLNVPRVGGGRYEVAVSSDDESHGQAMSEKLQTSDLRLAYGLGLRSVRQCTVAYELKHRLPT